MLLASDVVKFIEHTYNVSLSEASRAVKTLTDCVNGRKIDVLTHEILDGIMTLYSIPSDELKFAMALHDLQYMPPKIQSASWHGLRGVVESPVFAQRGIEWYTALLNGVTIDISMQELEQRALMLSATIAFDSGAAKHLDGFTNDVLNIITQYWKTDGGESRSIEHFIVSRMLQSQILLFKPNEFLFGALGNTVIATNANLKAMQDLGSKYVELQGAVGQCIAHNCYLAMGIEDIEYEPALINYWSKFSTHDPHWERIAITVALGRLDTLAIHEPEGSSLIEFAQKTWPSEWRTIEQKIELFKLVSKKCECVLR